MTENLDIGLILYKSSFSPIVAYAALKELKNSCLKNAHNLRLFSDKSDSFALLISFGGNQRNEQ